MRYHICWGSWNGPHTTDVPLQDIVDLVLRVNARPTRRGGQPAARARVESLAATSNCRRQDPDPGRDQPLHQRGRAPASSWRSGIENFASCRRAGERDRRHGLRLLAELEPGARPPEVQWAKLRALAEGARLASERLWSSPAHVASTSA